MRTLITLLVALTLGGIGGWSLSTQREPTHSATTPIDQEISTLHAAPLAEDFVSLRPALERLPIETLSEDERMGLSYMREEEKLARDVYTTLYETWGQQIFSNIAQSEQTHTEAIRDLLEKYGVSDPVTDDTIGVFHNTDLQQPYTDLVTRGHISIEEALSVGALIEDLDIHDLQQEITKTNNTDIILVYENLTRGSRNHLRSFVSLLTDRGISYTPQHISQVDFDTIITTAQERGSHTGGAGSNSGRGWGNR